MEITVRILLVILVTLIAIGVSIFVGRYFKLKITYWFGITVSLSISSLIFSTINQIIRPDMSDVFFSYIWFDSGGNRRDFTCDK